MRAVESFFGIGCLWLLRRSHAGWCCALLVSLLAARGHAQTPKEYQIKAGFIHNFTKFVEWPEERFADASSPIVVAVFNGNSLSDELRQVVNGRKVNGRAIVVQDVRSAEEAKGAHVVFVGAREEKLVESAIDSLHAAGVLTVGESERFAALRGVIVFTRVGDNVRFEIDVGSAARGGLKISAQLQKLATCIRNRP